MARTLDISAARVRHRHLRGRTRELVRDLTGVEALAAASRASRRRDLSRLLEFTSRRRLARAYCPQTPDATSPDARTGGPAPRDRRETGGARASTRATATARTAGAPRLLSRTAVTPDLLRLTLERPAGFDYRPGQHVKIGVPGLLRNYSLVSAPHEGHLEFFAELFPEGRLSRRLRTLQPGAAMALGERAKGDLAVDERYTTQFLIATVTGVAPYVSFLRDHVHRTAALGRRRFVVLHGASYADELGYADELAELARRHPGTITYFPTVSRPEEARNAGWSGARGRVETHVEPLLTRLGMSPVDTAVFACGNPGMVKSVDDQFRRRGFTVHTEPFD